MSTAMIQSSAPTKLGFSRLINEKTMIPDASPADEAIEILCPAMPNEDEKQDFDDRIRFANKLISDLVIKSKANPFFITYSPNFYIKTAQNDLVKGSDVLDVYLPIQMIGTKINHTDPGYPTISINQSVKMDGDSFDQYEHIRGSQPATRTLVSTVSTAKATHKILTASFKALFEKSGNSLSLLSLELDYNNKTIDCRVRMSGKYLKINYGSVEQTNTKSPKRGSVSGRSSSAMSNSGAAESNSNNDNGPDIDMDDELGETSSIAATDSEEAKEDATAKKARQLEEARLKKLLEAKLKAEENTYRELHLVFQASFLFNMKDKIYVIPRPYGHDLHLNDEHVWRLCYHYKENCLLSIISRADRCQRERACVALTYICAADEELEVIKPYHQRQALLHSIESCVDENIDSGGRWQRLSLLQCTRQILAGIRQHCATKTLYHYYLYEWNLFHGVPLAALSKAMVKAALLVKSNNAILRAVNAAIIYKENEPQQIIISNPDIEETVEESVKGEIFTIMEENDSKSVEENDDQQSDKLSRKSKISKRSS